MAVVATDQRGPPTNGKDSVGIWRERGDEGMSPPQLTRSVGSDASSASGEMILVCN